MEEIENLLAWGKRRVSEGGFEKGREATSPVGAVAGEEGPLGGSGALVLGLGAAGGSEGEVTASKGELHHGGEIQLLAGGNEGSRDRFAQNDAFLGATGGDGEGCGAAVDPQGRGEGERKGSAVGEGLPGLEAEGAGGECGEAGDELALGGRGIHLPDFALRRQLPALGCGGGEFGGEEEGLSREVAKGTARLAAQECILFVEITGAQAQGGEGIRTPGQLQASEGILLLGCLEDGGGEAVGCVENEAGGAFGEGKMPAFGGEGIRFEFKLPGLERGIWQWRREEMLEACGERRASSGDGA